MIIRIGMVVMYLLLLSGEVAAEQCYSEVAKRHQLDEYVLAAVIESLYSSDDTRNKLVKTAIRKGKVHGVDPALVLAVIHAESGFNAKAVSHRGAQGLMQIMPETGKELGLKRPFDADENIDAGVRYLAYLQKKFSSQRLVLAAYNAGEGAVRRNKGVPPYKETIQYVKKVTGLVGHYSQIVDSHQVPGKRKRCDGAKWIAVALAAERDARGSTWEAVGALFSENPVAQRKFRKDVYQNWKAVLAGNYALEK